MELSKEQSLALLVLAKSSLKDRFYWTGGTLLSHYYLKHRLSLDIDFFTEIPFGFEEVNAWVQEYKQKAGFVNVSYKKIFDRYEFIFSEPNQLRVEFVLYNHEKKTLGERIEYQGVLIDSLEDIAANKVMAMCDRNEPKDLFDIYFLLTKKGFTAESMIDLAQRKFGVSISESLFWSEPFKALEILDELKPLMLGSEENNKKIISEIKDYFEKNSAKFLRKQLI